MGEHAEEISTSSLSESSFGSHQPLNKATKRVSLLPVVCFDMRKSSVVTSSNPGKSFEGLGSIPLCRLAFARVVLTSFLT